MDKSLKELIKELLKSKTLDLNQTFMVVEKMREKGWGFGMLWLTKKGYSAEFAESLTSPKVYRAEDIPTPTRAILLAAYKALEGN